MNGLLNIIRPTSAYQEYLDTEGRVDQIEITAQDERLEAEVCADMEQQDRDNVRAETDPFVAILCMPWKERRAALNALHAQELEDSCLEKGLRARRQ